MRKKSDLMENLEVLMFLIKSAATSVCGSVSYLATLILFTTEGPAGCCFFLSLSGLALGGVGVCRTWKHQSGFRSPAANRSERLP